MSTRSIINRTIILSVYVLAGLLLARSVYYESIIGVICAIIGVVAWTVFLYRLNRLQREEQALDELLDE